MDTLTFDDHVFIFIELKSPTGYDSTRITNTLAERLRDAVGKPLNLKIQHLLTREDYRVQHLDENGRVIEYGGDDVVPRR